MSDDKTVTKKKWIYITEKIVIGVLGFISVWLFTSVVELRQGVAALKGDKQLDRRQWEAMTKLNDRIRRTEVETEVNRRVQETLIELMLDRTDGSNKTSTKPVLKWNKSEDLRKSKELLKHIKEMKKPTDVDDYIQREQMVAPQTK